jgi:hypothetical protein
MRVGLATPEIRGQLIEPAANSSEDNDTPVNAKELRNR